MAHKERIKQMRKKVDVLTMTATPIPRTLNMSLVGIRDMSVIETPPKDRLAIQTNVVKFDAAVIARAVRQEMARGGQVFFVHNRVESIYSMANLLQRLVPEARVVVGHGQMPEDALERAMLDFMAHKFDVLLATTIVENGLDIPNANTIIINRADRYGLSQLYQLRGRVGRSDRPAYAYLLIPPEESLSPVARKRLAAIKEFSDLGSGFRVAALDLEIRGAGNLLGGAAERADRRGGLRDVHEAARGDDSRAEGRGPRGRRARGGEPEGGLPADRIIRPRHEPAADASTGAWPRRAPKTRSAASWTRSRDRYGAPPDRAAQPGRLRAGSGSWPTSLGIETVDREGSAVVFKFREKTKVDPMQMIEIVRERGDLQLVPPDTVKLDLRAPGAGNRELGSDATAPPLATGHVAASETGGSRKPARRPKPRRQPAWWTARATAGEVTPGFTKAEILKTAPEDPRAPDGVLAKSRNYSRMLRRS